MEQLVLMDLANMTDVQLDDELARFTIKDLKSIASALNIIGRSKWRKSAIAEHAREVRMAIREEPVDLVAPQQPMPLQKEDDDRSTVSIQDVVRIIPALSRIPDIGNASIRDIVSILTTVPFTKVKEVGKLLQIEGRSKWKKGNTENYKAIAKIVATALKSAFSQADAGTPILATVVEGESPAGEPVIATMATLIGRGPDIANNRGAALASALEEQMSARRVDNNIVINELGVDRGAPQEQIGQEQSIQNAPIRATVAEEVFSEDKNAPPIMASVVIDEQGDINTPTPIFPDEEPIIVIPAAEAPAAEDILINEAAVVRDGIAEVDDTLISQERDILAKLRGRTLYAPFTRGPSNRIRVFDWTSVDM